MTTYDSLLSAYTLQMRGLFAPEPGAEPLAVTRGGAGPSPAVLAERAAGFAEADRALGEEHKTLLETAQGAAAQGAEWKALTQVQAELTVAEALIAAAEAELRGDRPGKTTRGGSTVKAAQALENLAGVLAVPVEQGLTPFLPKMKAVRGGRSLKREKACQALQAAAGHSLKSISRQAAKAGSAALDTLLSLDGDLVAKAVSLVSAELGARIEAVLAGVTQLIKNLVQTAARLLLQAYDLVLALIGKDAEAAARKQVQTWVEELRKDHKAKGDEPGLAEKLVTGLFAVDETTSTLDERLEKSAAEVQALVDAAGTLEQLAAAYELKAKKVQDTLKAVGSARGLARAAAMRFPVVASALPYVELLSAGVTLGLMGYALFTGYDYADSGKAVFFERFQVEIPSRVTGVRATLLQILG